MTSHSQKITIDAATQNRYFDLKSQVKKAFYEAASALREIHERDLYLAEYQSFDDFCMTELGFGARQGYHLIGAARVVDNVNARSHIAPPKSEYIARPLAKLPPEDQAEVWEEIAENHEPEEITNNIVKAHVERHIQNREEENNVGIIPQSDTYREIERPALSGPDEKRTSQEIFNHVFFILQGVDLDPCADEFDSLPVSRHLSKQDNSLVLPWAKADGDPAKVFVHPPESLVGEFVAKAVNELEEENIEAAVLYLPAEPWREWNGLIKEFPRVYLDRLDPEYKSGRMLVLISKHNLFFENFENESASLGWLYGYIGE